MRTIRRNHVARLTPLVVILGLAACASSGTSIRTNSAPDFDVTAYRTFGFLQPLSTDRGNVRSILSTNLIDATVIEMQKAGFRRDDQNPDLLVNFVTTTRETLQSRPSTSVSMHHSRGRYNTWGGYSMGMSTTQVVQRTEGTLGVDIIDRRLNQLVWEGAATGRLTDQMRDNIDQVTASAIRDIFAQFP